MALTIFMLCQVLWQSVAVSSETVNGSHLMGNSTDADKDMYVIHAMVYQIGIVTNRTDQDIANATGSQEALTFYHNNGSHVDLSKIPSPLLTNVTAQNLVAVAPIISSQNDSKTEIEWHSLNHLTRMPYAQNSEKGLPSLRASVKNIGDVSSEQNIHNDKDMFLNNLYKTLFKRETHDSVPVAIRNGSAIIPPAAGIESIAIPPLLMLNNNMSKIPVPIPNTSVIHYAKINTLITKP